MSDKLISPKVRHTTQTCDILEPYYLDLLLKDISKENVILEWLGEYAVSPEMVIDENKKKGSGESIRNPAR